MPDMANQWLKWAREIQALAQNGFHYAQDEYERSRASRLLEITADMIASGSDMRATDALIAFTAQPGYATPKVDVRAAVFNRDKRILLVREAADGGWTLPGGWADVGEGPRNAVERETQEESGLRVQATRLVGVYDANRIEDKLSLFHAYKLVFICQPIGGEIKPSMETSEVGYFSLEDLPQPFSEHRTTPRHIQDAVAAYCDPNLPTVFD